MARYGDIIELDDVEVARITVRISFDDVKDEVLEKLTEEDIRAIVHDAGIAGDIAESHLGGMDSEAEQAEWFNAITGIEVGGDKFELPTMEFVSMIDDRVLEIRNASTRQLLGLLLPRAGGALLRMFDHDAERDTGWVRYDSVEKAKQIAKLLVYGFYAEATYPTV